MHSGNSARNPLASTPPGMPGTHSPNILVGGRQREYPPILLRTFVYSRPTLVDLRSLSHKPFLFGYKTPPVRFSPLLHPHPIRWFVPPTLNSRWRNCKLSSIPTEASLCLWFYQSFYKWFYFTSCYLDLFIYYKIVHEVHDRHTYSKKNEDGKSSIKHNH